MNSFSGKFVVRLPAALHRSLFQQSQASGTSLNKLCVSLLSLGLNSGSGEARRSLVDWEGRGFFILQALSQSSIEPLSLVLFGSVAREEQRTNSDTDLLIVLDNEAKITRELYRHWDGAIAPVLREKGLATVSPHFVTRPRSVSEAGGLWFEVAIDGKLLHDPSGKTASVLRDIREAMAAGRIKRKLVHGHPYWIRETEPKIAK